MSRAVLDRPRARPRRRRRGTAAVGTLSLLTSALGVAAHYWTPSSAVLLGISAFAPYLMLAAPVALALLLTARWWPVAAVAAVACGLWITALVPLYGATATPPAHARTLVVMTANLRLGEASAASVVAAVKRNHVDVLMIEELTLGERWALHEAGLGDVLPFHSYDARPGAQGTGLWSRFYLYDENQRRDFSFAFITARIAVPDFPCDPVVAALHMQGPWPDSGGWDDDIRHLPSVLAELGAQPCAVLVGGDFNATPDVSQFRHLLTHGIADAAAQAGGGVTGTYPSNTWLPPMIAIDHVLTRDAVATSVHTVDIAGSDHRALVAHVAVRRQTPGSG